MDRIRYFPNTSTIKVDTIEVWSQTRFDVRTGRKIGTSPGRPIPQTISILQTPKGWYITDIRFVRN